MEKPRNLCPSRLLLALLLAASLASSLALGGCALDGGAIPFRLPAQTFVGSDAVPEYSGEPYVQLDGNVPSFTEEELEAARSACFEDYGALDPFGRCTGATACVGPATMPARGEERESISDIKPTGWQSSRYSFIDGESLYNRCHLIAWMLGAENANPRNLITGTRYMNTQGMLPFETAIADYIDATGKPVIMRVTPDFREGDLVARGVRMEAHSVDDDGHAISFNVYCYNVQPGVAIDYSSGCNWLDDSDSSAAGDAAVADEAFKDDGAEESAGSSSSPDAPAATLEERQTFGGASAGGDSSSGIGSGAATSQDPSTDLGYGSTSAQSRAYVLNTRSHRFHLPECPGVNDISSSNRSDVTAVRDALLAEGYQPCGRCNP